MVELVEAWAVEGVEGGCLAGGVGGAGEGGVEGGLRGDGDDDGGAGGGGGDGDIGDSGHGGAGCNIDIEITAVECQRKSRERARKRRSVGRPVADEEERGDEVDDTHCDCVGGSGAEQARVCVSSLRLDMRGCSRIYIPLFTLRSDCYASEHTPPRPKTMNKH